MNMWHLLIKIRLFVCGTKMSLSLIKLLDVLPVLIRFATNRIIPELIQLIASIFWLFVDLSCLSAFYVYC